MKLYIVWVLLFGPLQAPHPTGTFSSQQDCIDAATRLTVAMHGRGTAFCMPSDDK